MSISFQTGTRARLVRYGIACDGPLLLSWSRFLLSWWQACAIAFVEATECWQDNENGECRKALLQ